MFFTNKFQKNCEKVTPPLPKFFEKVTTLQNFISNPLRKKYVPSKSNLGVTFTCGFIVFVPTSINHGSERSHGIDVYSSADF